MRIRPPTYIVLAVLWATSVAFAGDMTAECPARIPETDIKPDKPIAGWVTTVPGQMHLKAAGMLGGAPHTKTYLVPDSDTQTTRTFGYAKGEERWLFCDYGAVELARKVGEGGTKCVITTKTKKPENKLSAVVECK